ncbi:MAG: tetratricopeptide repeat protein [Hyphomicrobiales bacterium]
MKIILQKSFLIIFNLLFVFKGICSETDSLITVINSYHQNEILKNSIKLMKEQLNFYPHYSVKIGEYIIDHKLNTQDSTDFGEFHFILAKSYREAGKYKNALNIINKIKSHGYIVDSADLLIEEGNVLWKLGDYKGSYQKLYKSIAICKNNDQLINAYMGLGLIGYTTSRFTNSLNYFNKALEICDSIENKQYRAMLFNSMASIYFNQGKHDKAIDLLMKAYNINIESDNIKRQSANLGNLAQIYNAKGESKISDSLYQKAILIDRKINNKIGLATKQINLCLTHFKENNFDKALQLSLEAYSIFKDIDYMRGLGFTSNILGNIYTTIGDYEKASNYLELGKHYNETTNNTSQEAYNKYYHSIYYQKIGKLDKAIEALNEYITYNDKLVSKEKQSITAELEARYDLHEKETKIQLMNKELQFYESQKQLDKLKAHTIIIGLLAFLIIGIVRYSRIKQKEKQYTVLYQKTKEVEKAKIELMEISLKNQALETQKLQSELLFKKQELTSFALHIVQKNELLNSLKKDLKNFQKKVNNKENNEIIKSILLQLNQHLKSENEIEDFQNRIDETNSIFFHSLEQKFPELTKGEKRLCALLRINLSSKEIASLNNISYKAVEMARYRLRKKLNIDNNVNLNEFLQKI